MTSFEQLWHFTFSSLLASAYLYIPCVFLGLSLASIAVWETLKDIQSKQKSALIFLGIFILGLILRFIWIFYTQPLPVSDYDGYWHTALQIMDGDWSFSSIDKHPGIILLIYTALKLFGLTPWSVWGMNLILSGFLLILSYRVGLFMGGPRTAVLGAFLVAIQPQLITYTGLFASELPTLFFYLLILWFFLYSQSQKTNALQWAMLGCTTYAAILTRSTSLLFLILIPTILFIFQRKHWKINLVHSLILCGTVITLLSSWIYHQVLLTGRMQLFWGSEIWLVSTSHYQTEGRLVNPWQLPGLDVQIQRNTHGLTGPANRLAALDTMKRWALPIIQKDPWRYLREGSTRIRHILWTTSETGIRDTQLGSQVLQQWPEKLVTRLAEISKHFWRITLVLSILGFFFLVLRTKEPTTKRMPVFLGAFLTIWIAFHYLIGIASDRWAVQIIPYITLLASNSIIEILTMLAVLTKKILTRNAAYLKYAKSI